MKQIINSDPDYNKYVYYDLDLLINGIDENFDSLEDRVKSHYILISDKEIHSREFLFNSSNGLNREKLIRLLNDRIDYSYRDCGINLSGTCKNEGDTDVIKVSMRTDVTPEIIKEYIKDKILYHINNDNYVYFDYPKSIEVSKDKKWQNDRNTNCSVLEGKITILEIIE